jgi:hypothetical protein
VEVAPTLKPRAHLRAVPRADLPEPAFFSELAIQILLL